MKVHLPGIFLSKKLHKNVSGQLIFFCGGGEGGVMVDVINFKQSVKVVMTCYYKESWCKFFSCLVQ